MRSAAVGPVAGPRRSTESDAAMFAIRAAAARSSPSEPRQESRGMGISSTGGIYRPRLPARHSETGAPLPATEHPCSPARTTTHPWGATRPPSWAAASGMRSCR